MPILPAEPDFSLQPLDEDATSFRQSRHWWCLRPKPRQEKAAARLTCGRQIAYYLPGRPMKIAPRWAKREVHRPPLHQLPLLAGRRPRTHRGAARKSPGQRARRPRPDEPGPRPRQIHQMISSGLTVVPGPSCPWVHVRSRPAPGRDRSEVISAAPSDQFIAIVQFLGRGAAVDLEDWQVDLIHPPPDPRPAKSP